MTNPIECVKSEKEENLWTVYYFGKEAGWIKKTKQHNRDVTLYKALTVHNSIYHFYSLDSAKSWVIGEYH